MKLMLYVSALVAGVSLAGWQAPGLIEHPQTGSRGETSVHRPPESVASDVASQAASGDAGKAAEPVHPPSPPASGIEPREPPDIIAGTNLVLKRQSHPDGEFAGYRVVQGPPDPRFAVGDIITAVDGRPAEDSAAGTELLLIALRHPDTPVNVARRK